MIVFNEKIIGVWFIALAPGSQDFLGALYTAEDGELEFKYRFRYYHSDDPHDPKDKKKWYILRSKKDLQQTKEQMLSNIRTLVHILEVDSGQKADEIMYKGDYQAFFDEFASKPWAHMSEEEVGNA